MGRSIPTISLDPLLLSTDEPTSPKKPKSVPELEHRDVAGGVASLLPSEWTSVRIDPLSPRISDSADFGRSLKCGILNKFKGNTDAPGLGTIL